MAAMAASRNAACNIITDSCCDLPQGYLEENGVAVLHFSYVGALGPDDVSPRLDDMFASWGPHEFYGAMREGAQPMTSQPSQAEFESVFRTAVESGVPSVYLSLSSGISGCYEGALAALGRLKEELGEDVPLRVVDTKVGSTGLALLVVEAIRRRDAGCTADELAAWAESAHDRISVSFMVDDLNALSRGGRIPAGAAAVGTFLDVKPLLSFAPDGKLSMIGVARGRKKGMRRLVDIFAKCHAAGDCGDVVTLGNADCPDDLRVLEEMLRAEAERQGTSPEFVQTNIGPTIGCHVGPGMISCVFWGEARG